jgi:predicted SAM-dependent methyltransferase
MDFSKTQLSVRRSIVSYAKVQRLYALLIRNRSFQLTSKQQRDCIMLNIGCGDQLHPGFINIDYYWLPGLDLCWDIANPLPFQDASIAGVFTEHCLEHLTLKAAENFVSDVFRILRPGGILRVVVPDAELFLRAYVNSAEGSFSSFPNPYDQCLMMEGSTPMAVVNSIFRDHGHQYAYDYEALHMLLNNFPFTNIYRVGFRSGCNPRLLIDNEDRCQESLYVEAVK